MPKRNFGLDILRSLAIMGVLAVHLLKFKGVPPELAKFFSRGWIGVDLFFVLSGFLITDQVLKQNSRDSKFASIKKFWVRRWTRTLPLYFTVLFVYVMVAPSFFDWTYLLFLQNTGPLKDFIQSWSLCIEEQFYLVFPLLFFWLPSKNKFLWLSPLVLSIGLRAYFFYTLGPPWVDGHKIWEFDTVIRYRTITHLDSIAMGIILAMTSQYWLTLKKSTKMALGVCGVFIIALACLSTVYSPTGLGVIFLFTGLAVGFSGILIVFYEIDIGTEWLKYLVNRLAIFSYGIYLWNSLLLDFFIKNFEDNYWVFNSILFVFSSVALSALTYKIIEKPGLRLRGEELKHHSNAKV